MSDIKLSVIIPAYNSMYYIERCLNSILVQTLAEIEIIVVDDCSNDETPKILEEYKKKDARINILTLSENMGQGYARNKGIEIAKGEYIGFVDSDDFVDSDYFEKLYNTAVCNNCDIAVASILKHKKQFKKYNVRYNKILFAENIQDKIRLCGDTKNFFFYAWNKIYKTDLLKTNNIKFSEGRIYEDVSFAVRALYYSSKIVSVPKVKYHYKERKNSSIRRTDSNGKKAQDLIFAYQNLQQFCRKNKIILPERLNYYTSCWYNPFVKTYIGEYQQKDLLFGLIPLKRMNNDLSFPVDLVYLWVDGSDPQWLSKKLYWQKQYGHDIDAQAITAGRFVDNEELKYSLRSAEKYVSWINKIYIVTDSQVPKWLDTSNPKIQMVFHRDFIPEKYLPLFNSEAIETFLADIPDLSEHFIFGNDDMYLGRYLTKNFFFDKEGKPVIRLKSQVSKKHIATSMFTRSILNQQKIIKDKFGKFFPYAPHHNIDAYLKSCYQDCQIIFENLFQKTKSHKFREEGDIQRVAITYYMLAVNKGRLKRYSRVDKYLPLFKRIFNCAKKVYQADSIVINLNNKNPYGKLRKYKPSLFCTNDGEGITDFDRRRMKIFLEETFPEKSSFEL